MSSSPRSWTLRTRLLVEVVALLALVCVVIGVVTDVALQHFLVAQLNAQLASASNRSAAARQHPPDHRPPGGENGLEFLGAPGQSAGTLGARVVDGVVVDAAMLTETGDLTPLATSEAVAVQRLPADGKPRTIDVAGSEYRAVAVRMPDRDVLVTGLPLSGVDDTLVRLALIMAVVAVAGVCTAGVAGTLIVRRTLRPLRRVAATASDVAELPVDRDAALSVRVPDADTDPRTEVGQVGNALNRMLGHIASALSARERSEARVRQFVADASHELRTPLAAIRGYAELARRGREAVPPDVAYAMGRVEAESTRMSTLVDELLLLARLDSGRPLARERVDLSRLMADAVDDAHVAGPDHTWRLELPAEPVLVDGDGERLHQVVTNVLTNARTHTPPGTVVTATLSVDSDGVTAAVVDDGPGIPGTLLPEIFERFARGDDARSRAAGSTGLGLAIAAAIAGAHGGTVAVTSEPGRTAFTVRLPVRSASAVAATVS
jgi:two-component system, OmpR family, sensor kinase